MGIEQLRAGQFISYIYIRFGSIRTYLLANQVTYQRGYYVMQKTSVCINASLTMPIALSLSHQVLWPCVDVVEHQVTYMQLRKLIHDVYIELLSQGKLFSSEKQYFVGAL